MRHCLINGFNTKSHGKFFNQFLCRVVEINLPTVVSFGYWQFDTAVMNLFRQVMKEVFVEASVLHVIRRHLLVIQSINNYPKIKLKLKKKDRRHFTFSSPLISTLMWSRMAPETADLSVRFSKLYQTSISPDNVRTSMIVCPRKSSDSRVNFCLIFDLKSLSSSQTRTLMRSDELWHSLEFQFIL